MRPPVEFPDRKAHRRRQLRGIRIVLGVLGAVLVIALLVRWQIVSQAHRAEMPVAKPVKPVRKPPPKPPAPKPAPAPVVPERSVRMSAIHAALRSGDRVELQRQLDGLQDNFRDSLRATDPSEVLQQYDNARAEAWDVKGILGTAWLDKRNFFALAETAERRNDAAIDDICKAMAQVPGIDEVAVNLEFGSPMEDDAELLRRRCGQTRPEQTQREDEAASSGKPGAKDDTEKERDPVREESLRMLRETTPEL